jgi:hypothetical protein
VRPGQTRNLTRGGGLLLALGRKRENFHQVRVFAIRFCKICAKPEMDLRGVGHLFFLAIQNTGYENKKLRWNRLWRAAVRSGVAGYMRRKKKNERAAWADAHRPSLACPGLSAVPKRGCTPGLKPGYGVVPSLLRTTTLSHICKGCLCGSL